MEHIIYLVEGVWQVLCDLISYDVGDSVQQAWVGAAIGIASSLLNAGLGAASAAKQQREEQREYERQKAENQAWYNRRYNEDATQRADAQRALTRMNDEIKKRSLAAAGKKAVMGGTDASQAAVQQANAEAMGNAVSDITARADAKKDAIEQSYRSRGQQLDAQHAATLAATEKEKRDAMAQAATGAISAAANIGDLGGKKKTDTSGTGNASNGFDVSKYYTRLQDPFAENMKRNNYGGWQ